VILVQSFLGFLVIHICVCDAQVCITATVTSSTATATATLLPVRVIYNITAAIIIQCIVYSDIVYSVEYQ